MYAINNAICFCVHVVQSKKLKKNIMCCKRGLKHVSVPMVDRRVVCVSQRGRTVRKKPKWRTFMSNDSKRITSRDKLCCCESMNILKH